MSLYTCSSKWQEPIYNILLLNAKKLEPRTYRNIIICRGYRVEKMDLEKGRWEPVKSTRKPELDVPKLVEGHQSKFRVIAESPNGDSEPLVLEDPITAKDPFSEY